jgi:Cof subfamily protein (haloacid dehalogenase superfamily)
MNLPLAAQTTRPLLIGTDLDGTIVADYGRISNRTIEAFTAAHEAGIEIFFVTGRPPRWMPEIKSAFGFGNAICANGALHYDLMNDRILEEWLIPIENQLEFINRMRAHIPNVNFAVEYGDEFHHEQSYIPRWDVGVDVHPVSNIEDRITEPAFKMLARCLHEELTSDQMLQVALTHCSDLVTITHSNRNESLLEISALGVSKGQTLAKLAARAGIGAADAVTFGDNPNDFSMLQWADRSWTLADGHEEAPDHAKFVAAGHLDDGVAQVIEQLLLLPTVQ